MPERYTVRPPLSSAIWPSHACTLSLLLAAWVLSACALAAGTSDATARALTLGEALNIALDENRGIKNAELEVAKAADRVAAIRTHRLPKLHLDLSESYNLTPQSYNFKSGSLGTLNSGELIPPQDVAIDAEDGLTTVLSVGVRQPLLQLYRIGLAIDRHEVAQSIAEQQLRARRQELVKRVKQAYYEILKTQNELQATEESIAFYHDLEQLVSRYLEEKTVLEYQVMEVRSRLARTEHRAYTERNLLETRQERLNSLLGRDVETRFRVSPVGISDAPLPPVAEAENTAVAKRPEINEAELRLKEAQYGYRITKSGYFPDVDLQLRYSRLYNTEFIPDQESSIRLTARWEFFDWGRKSKEMSKKNAAIRQARNEIDEARAQILVEVNSRLRKLEDARSLVRVTELSQAAAREKLRVLMNQYRQQAVLLDDVLKAESDLADASSAYHDALLSVWTARADLVKAMGEG
jgi:outer membrane protein